MKLIRGKHRLTSQHTGCVVTLGNFDGVHLGHQALLKQLQSAAHAARLPSVLITFEPQPKEFFARQQTVPRLMRLSEKWLAFKPWPIDYVLCLRFNAALAALTPQAFVRRILIEQLAAKVVIVGDDFRFGARRAGDYALLQQLAPRYGFTAIGVPTVIVAGERVSSTRVRTALASGDLALVNRLLGRPYCLCGKVIRGERLGRQLGYPTANIDLHRKVVALAGVFVVRVHGLAARTYDGVANLGTRPTVGGKRILLEVHLFDFAADIYGSNIQVEFLHKLRDEQYYSTLDELVVQMNCDAAAARGYFRDKKSLFTG